MLGSRSGNVMVAVFAVLLSSPLVSWPQTTISSFVIDGATRSRIDALKKKCEKMNQIICLTAIIESDGSEAPAFALRSSALHRLGRDQEALADIERAIILDGGQPGYFYLRSGIRSALGDLEGAEADAKHSLEMTKRSHPELAELEENLADDPRDVQSLLRRYEIRSSRTDFVGAADDIERALEVMYEEEGVVNPQLYSLCASAKVSSGDPQGAESILTEGIARLDTIDDRAVRLLERRAVLREKVLGDQSGAAADKIEIARIRASVQAEKADSR